MYVIFEHFWCFIIRPLSSGRKWKIPVVLIWHTWLHCFGPKIEVKINHYIPEWRFSNLPLSTPSSHKFSKNSLSRSSGLSGCFEQKIGVKWSVCLEWDLFGNVVDVTFVCLWYCNITKCFIKICRANFNKFC